jgi:predicted amidohydrolase
MHIAGTKVHLVPLEREDGLDLSPGSVEDYAVLRLPGATVGVIVCADAWDPAIAQHLVDQGAEVLMQVSANPEQWAADTRATWREGLFARVQELGVFGVSVMGVGNLLGLPLQGRSAALAPCSWTEDGSGYLAEADSATAERIVTATFDLRLVRPD